MYLKGNFERKSWPMDNPMTITLSSICTKEDLIACKNNETYQVINIIEREYFDPKRNVWVKF